MNRIILIGSRRLKSDCYYSSSIVYKNFPWPSPNNKQKESVEISSQLVLDARKKYPNLLLATLCNSNTMIPEQVKTEQKLDRSIESTYGHSFIGDTQRVAFLFELHQKASEVLFIERKRK